MDSFGGRVRNSGGGGAKQGRFEPQEIVAIGRRAFRKQNNNFTGCQTLGNLTDLLACFASFFSFYKNRALQFCEPAEQWPGLHIRFGNEAKFAERPDNNDVEPRSVIGRNEERSSLGKVTMDMDPDSQHETGKPMPDLRDGLANRQFQPQADQLKRCEANRYDHHAENGEKHLQICHFASQFFWL